MKSPKKRVYYKPKPKYFWSVLSVSGVLFLIGLFGLFSLHSKDFVQSFKESFKIAVELTPSATDRDIEDIKTGLSKDSSILNNSIVYISKEEGLKTMQEELGGDLIWEGLPNPLFDVIQFQVRSVDLAEVKLKNLKEKYLNKYPAIVEISYEGTMIDQVVANLDRVAVFLLILGILLAMIATALIYNSIRLSLYANRFLIRNMELVGASWSFIRKPFLKKSLKHGFFSALLGMIVLAVVAGLLYTQIPQLMEYFNGKYILYIALGMIAGGILINVLGTYYVVTRFLKMRISNLYL